MGILKRWNIKSIFEEHGPEIDEIFSMDRSYRNILGIRGIDDYKSYSDYVDIDLSMLHPPKLLPDIDIAVERIKRAIKQDEKIYIYGDYDTDGITSTALMMKTLKFLGARVDYYLPDRFEEGYGISKDGLSKILQSGASLVISVDCGIVSVEEADFAREIGLDLIITDHHNPQDEFPKSLALIDPKLSYSKYPFTELAGVGVAFKIACMLLGDALEEKMDELLLLASIGTVADLVPMVGENRIIVKEGLKRYERGLNYGVDALIDVSRVSYESLSPEDIGFSIAPRLNSSGRLAHASIGLELLLCEDYESAYTIADELNKLNSQRQYKTSQILKFAQSMIEENARCFNDKIIIVWGEDWHEGVLGIVASKLVEKYSRPAIVLCLHEGVLKGSARSVKGFSIFDCIHSVNELLIKFGGHNQAAGLSLRYELLDYFISGIHAYCEEYLTDDLLVPSIDIDTDIDIRAVDLQYYDEIMKLYPFGVGNKMPVFVSNGVNIDEFRMVGKSQNHLKFSTYNHGVQIGGIKFFYDGYIPRSRGNFKADICFEMSENYYNGVNSLQLKLSDIRFYEPNSCEFTKRAYTLYNMKLFTLLKNRDDAILLSEHYEEGIKHFLNDNAFLSKEYSVRSSSEIAKMLKSKEDIVITSYEAFLQLLYVMYDLNEISYDFDAKVFEQYPNIKLLPNELHLKKTSKFLDFPLLYIGISNTFDRIMAEDIYSMGFDNDILFENLANATFDRKRSIQLYTKIKKDGKCNIFEEFLNSGNILNDVIIWSFFEESHFIYSDECFFYCVMSEHEHHEFKHSNIDKKIKNLLISRRIKTWI